MLPPLDEILLFSETNAAAAAAAAAEAAAATAAAGLILGVSESSHTVTEMLNNWLILLFNTKVIFTQRGREKKKAGCSNCFSFFIAPRWAE